MPALLTTSGQRTLVNDILGITVGWRILELGVRDDYFAVWKRIANMRRFTTPARAYSWLPSGIWSTARLRNPILRAGGGISAAFGPGQPVESVIRNWLMSLNGDEHRLARGWSAGCSRPAPGRAGAAHPRNRPRTDPAFRRKTPLGLPAISWPVSPPNYRRRWCAACSRSRQQSGRPLSSRCSWGLTSMCKTFSPRSPA